MEYIVLEDDGYNWARWSVSAKSKKSLTDSWSKNGLSEDNAKLLEHTTEMPYGCILTIEKEIK